MKGFVRIPNRIFNCELKASELLVFCYLTSKKNHLSALTIRHETVANALGRSRNTILSAFKGLAEKGLVTQQIQYKGGWQVASQYHITHLPGGWFKLPRGIFRLQLNKSDFAVYLFVLRCVNAKDHGWPSTSQISQGCGISKPRVRQIGKTLASMLLISKAQYVKQCGAYGHNHFDVIALAVREALLKLYRKNRRQSIADVLWTAFYFLCPWLAIPIQTPVDLLSGLLKAKPGKDIFLRI